MSGVWSSEDAGGDGAEGFAVETGEVIVVISSDEGVPVSMSQGKRVQNSSLSGNLNRPSLEVPAQLCAYAVDFYHIGRPSPQRRHARRHHD